MSKTASEPLSIPFADTSAPVVVARPTNVARSVFHVAAGAVSLALIQLLPGRGWLFGTAAAFAITAWCMEAARRRSPTINTRLVAVFAPIAHAHERHRTNSSTWYMTALALLAAVAPMTAAELGVLVLALADPAAGIVGRRYGRTRLRAGRSLEGSAAFVIVGSLASLAWLVLAHGIAPEDAVVLALVAATAGAVAEVVVTRLDDNLVIPISVAAASAVVLGLA